MLAIEPSAASDEEDPDWSGSESDDGETLDSEEARSQDEQGDASDDDDFIDDSGDDEL
jgi:hypothetical protein